MGKLSWKRLSSTCRWINQSCLYRLPGALVGTVLLTCSNNSFAEDLTLDATGLNPSDAESILYDKNLSHPTFENYRLFRFEEDWSFLKDSSKSNDFFDPAKYIPLDFLGDSYLSFSGEQRQFVDHRSHQSLGIGLPANTVHEIEYESRTTLGADLHLGPYFRAYGELINGAYNGPIPNNRNFNNNLAVLDAFVEPMDQIGATKVGLRVGRQQITLGNGLFVDNREIASLPLSWDGVRAYADWGSGRIDAFALNRVVRHEGVLEDDRDHKSTLYGVYGSFDLPRFDVLGSKAKITAEPFFIGYSSENQGFDVPALQLTGGALPSFVNAEDYRQSYGVRIDGHIGDFDFDDTGIIQRGNFDGFNVDAWNIMTNTGYTFKNVPTTPRVSLHFDATSGGANAKTKTLNSYQPEFYFTLYYSEELSLAPINLVDLSPHIEVNLSKDASLEFYHGLYWRQTQSDAVYSGASYYAGTANAFRASLNARGYFIGQQPDLILRWNILPHVSLFTTLGYFMPSSMMKSIGAKDTLVGVTNFKFYF
jgi:hypothetical protein